MNRNATGGNAVTERDTDGNLTKNFLEGGFACETFDIIKARTPNYLCNRSSVPLENLAHPGGQGMIMNAMAEYYDRFNQFRSSNPAEAALFSNNLRTIFAQQQTQSTEGCNRRIAEAARGSGSFSALESHLSSYCISQYEKYKTYLEAVTQLQRRLTAIPNGDAHEMDRLGVYERLDNFHRGLSSGKRYVSKPPAE